MGTLESSLLLLMVYPSHCFLHDQIIAGTNPYQEFKLFKLNEEDLSWTLPILPLRASGLIVTTSLIVRAI